LFPFIFETYIEPKSNLFKAGKGAFWFFLINCMILGWMGSNPVAYPYITIGFWGTLAYFSGFLALGCTTAGVRTWKVG
jgi:quinol-cytochrome oxidoreductase complex cytochrome b subunit